MSHTAPGGGEYALRSMATVRDIMTKELITVEPSATVAETATVMGEHHVGSALVLEEESLAGIFTERDIVRALSQDFDAARHSISHYMTRTPTTVSPDATLQEALNLMLSGGFRHLPVVDGGHPIGILSMRDISRATAERAE
jgi:CBS domain-containing protein